MDQGTFSKSNRHQAKHGKHENNITETPSGPGSKIGPMAEKQAHDHSNIGSQDPTESQHPAFQSQNGEAVSTEAGKQTQDNGPSPRKLQLIHHKECHYHIPHQMQVTLMHEYRCNCFVQVEFIRFDFFDVHQPRIHFLWPFEKRRVAWRGVYDVHDHKYDHIDCNDSSADWDKLEIGHKASLQHFEVSLWDIRRTPGSHEWKSYLLCLHVILFINYKYIVNSKYKWSMNFWCESFA